MYINIEKEFVESSITRKYRKYYTVGAIILFTILIVITSKMVDNFEIFVLMIISFLGWLTFSLICYIVILYILLKNQKITYKDFLKIDENRYKYKNLIHSQDILILIEILKSNGINTRHKVGEALRHYQCMIPRNVVSQNQFSNILALTISILAFFCSDIVFHSEEIVQLSFLIILFVAMAYFMVKGIDMYFFRFFGTNELYKRLELSISEIYMKYYKR